MCESYLKGYISDMGTYPTVIQTISLMEITFTVSDLLIHYYSHQGQ